MHIDSLTPDHARELVEKNVWTVEALLEKLPHVQPYWMRDAVANSCEDRPELERRIVALMDAQTSEQARLYMGLVLFFWLIRADGMRFWRDCAATMRRCASWRNRDDLGCSGVAGRLPATCEEVFAAIAPLLQDPASYQGNTTLDFALSEPVFALSRSHTRPLLSHEHPPARDKVAFAYLNHGHDDGALDALAHGLFAPATLIAEQNGVWLGAREKACYALKTGAEMAEDPDTRSRAGELALSVIQQTLRAHEAQGRFPEWHEEGLQIEPLLQTVVLTRPAGAESVLLREAIGAGRESLHLRSLALLSYVDLCGSVPPEAQGIIIALVCLPHVDGLDDRLNQLVARKMIGLPMLLTAARNPAWCYMATQAIGAWPRGAEDGLVVDGLTVALVGMAAWMPAIENGSLDCLAGLLLRLPRSGLQGRAIIEALKQALETAKRNADKPWVAQQVLHQLVMFGEVGADDENDLDPWDAMWAHWQRTGIGWDEVPRLLVDAGVTIDSEPADGDESSDGNDEDELDDQDIAGRLCHLLGERSVPASLEDEGYEFPRHEVLLEQMASTVRPPLDADAFSQTGEWDGNTAVCRLRFVYQDQVHGLDARPTGDWLDVWALIDGFNGFLREIGHADRLFRLTDPSSWGGEFGILLCAHAERFARVNEQLRLPLQQR